MRGYDKASGGEKVVECFVMRLYIINLLSLVSGCATLMPYLHNLQSVPVLFREHVLINFSNFYNNRVVASTESLNSIKASSEDPTDEP